MREMPLHLKYVLALPCYNLQVNSAFKFPKVVLAHF